MKQEQKVPEEKKNAVKQIERLVLEYPVTAIVDLTGMPSPQLQKMRHNLRNSVLIYAVKKRLIALALKNIANDKKDIQRLTENTQNIIPALLFTKNSPFRLFKELKKSKISAPAKPGQIAPADIIIPAGPTPFAPGPIIGELGQFGIKTAVEAGKIAVKQEKVIVKQGEPITDSVASLIAKFGMKPMEIGLNLISAYESGILYSKKVLNIDEDDYIRNIKKSHSNAFRLAYSVAYPARDVVKLLLKKLARDSLAVSLELEIANKDTIKYLLEKAQVQAQALNQKA